MKSRLSYLLTITIIITLWSCQDEFNTDTIIGKWQLTETLADPGNGSGTYQPYDGDQGVTFRSDSTLSFIEALCSYDDGPDLRNGTFDKDSVYVNGCSYPYRYELLDEQLYIYPPCFEPCGLKFEKIAD